MGTLIISLIWGIAHKKTPSEQAVQSVTEEAVVETVVEVAPTHFIEMSWPVVTNNSTVIETDKNQTAVTETNNTLVLNFDNFKLGFK